MRARCALTTLLLVSMPALHARAGAVGSEFQVNTYTTGTQYVPEAGVGPDGSFVVVWASWKALGDPNTLSVQVRRFASDGSSLGAEMQANTYTTANQAEPDVAQRPDGSFVVVWHGASATDSYGIAGRLFDSAGIPIGSQFQVNTVMTGIQKKARVSVASSSGAFVVAWQSASSAGGDTSSYSVQARRFDSGGNGLGSDFQVNTWTTQSQRRADVAVEANGDFVVAWDSRDQEGQAYATGIFAQRFSSSGLAVGSEFLVNSVTANNQSYASVAADADGDFIVAWTGFDASSLGVRARRFASNGAAQGDEFQVNAFAPGVQQDASVAAEADGDFVVSWYSDAQDGSQRGVFARRYASDGTPIGSEFQVNTYTTGYQSQAAVAVNASGSRYVVAWAGVSGYDGYGVAARRYEEVVGTLSVTSPGRKRDRWGEDTTQRIRWVHTFGPGATFDVALSRDGGGNFTTIGSAVGANASAGNLYYLVDDLNACPTIDSAQVRVANTSNPAIDGTSPVFSIDCEPETNVIRPNAALATGVATKVKWKHNVGYRSRIQLMLAKDGNFAGVNVSPIGTLTKSQALNAGTYLWTPTTADCCTSAGSCRIRADWIDYSGERRRMSPPFNVDDGAGGVCPD